MNPIRSFAFGVVSDVRFEVLIMVCILSNTLVMGLTYFGEADTYGQVTHSLNLDLAT